MTRINVVDVSHLTNKHLVAEYKEITRPFNKVLKRIKGGTIDQVKIPERYCLGKGHETFFFDKLMWLWDRYRSLYIEMIKRGFNPDVDKYDEISRNFYNELQGSKWWNGYTPLPDDYYLNMSRLVIRCDIDDAKDQIRSFFAITENSQGV